MMNRLFFLFKFTLLLSLSNMAKTQDQHIQIIRDKMQSDLEAIIDDYEGVAGVHVIDLSSGYRWAYRDELVFPQASAIKIPILLELFRRAESDPELLGRRVEMTDEVRTTGSGCLLYTSPSPRDATLSRMPSCA